MRFGVLYNKYFEVLLYISDVTEHIRSDSCLSKSVPHLVLSLPTPVLRPSPPPLSLLLLLTGVICQCCYSTDSGKDCSSTTKFMKLVFHSRFANGFSRGFYLRDYVITLDVQGRRTLKGRREKLCATEQRSNFGR